MTNQEMLRKRLSKIALGYDKDLITPEINAELKKQALITQIKNPVYGTALNIGIKLFVISLLCFGILTFYDNSIVDTIAYGALNSAGFFIIGWILLRSVQ